MKHSAPLRWLFVLAALAAGACQRKSESTPETKAAADKAPTSSTTLAVVAESQRSKNFIAVSEHLDLGGTLYGYVDVEGDVLKLTGALKNALTQMAAAQPQLAMVAQQDLDAIARMLGLTDIKAFGVSSVPDGTGFFKNRMYFHTGGERHGLMAGFGGKPGPLKHVGLAPADAAFYGEAEIDMAVVYKTIKDVVAKVAGEPAGNMLEASLRQAGQQAALSIIDLIYGLKGRSALVLRVDPEQSFRAPGPQGIALPAFSLVLCVDGVGQVVEPSLAQSPVLRRAEEGGATVYQLAQNLPIPGLQPAIVIDGGTFYFTTALPFLRECRERKSGGLAEAAEFQKALAEVGAESNGISYISPRFFDGLRRIEALNPNLPAESKPMLAMMLGNLPKLDRPVVASRVNLDDGILVRAHMNRSFKQEAMMMSAYNPVTVGLLAAMAIPAFQKVRASSQEKAVLNNLRQLSAAADQYYLENGKDTTTFDQLVGSTDKHYIRSIRSVAGEDYSEIEFKQGEPLQVVLPDGRVVEYAP